MTAPSITPSITQGLVRGVDGVVTIAAALPGQAVRSAKMFAPFYLGDDTSQGDDMSQPYYYGNPQLYKMPKHLALSGEPSEKKMLPVIVIGIAGIIAYNIWFKKK